MRQVLPAMLPGGCGDARRFDGFALHEKPDAVEDYEQRGRLGDDGRGSGAEIPEGGSQYGRAIHAESKQENAGTNASNHLAREVDEVGNLLEPVFEEDHVSG